MDITLVRRANYAIQSQIIKCLVTNEDHIPGKFNWQEGFGAFSYSRSQIVTVIKFILNQEEHHKKKTFREEYIDFLKKFEIEYDEKIFV